MLRAPVWAAPGPRMPCGGPLLVLLLGRLAHALLLLVLRSRTRGRGQLGAQVLVLAEQPGQFGFDLIEEGIDLVLVIAFSEADGRELLVPHVLGGQRHLFHLNVVVGIRQDRIVHTLTAGSRRRSGCRR